MLVETSEVRKPSIGLTPLIDVVFILLIFFMLIVQFKKYQQLDISIAEAAADTSSALAKKPIQVLLANDGSCYINQIVTDCQTLKIPADLVADHQDIVLFFEADVELGLILQAHQTLSQSDMSVHLATRVHGQTAE